MPELQSPAVNAAADAGGGDQKTADPIEAAAVLPPPPAMSPDLKASKVSPAAPPAIVFVGHRAYIVSMAKACRDAEKFTDVRIKCQDGELVAHRMVLASCSLFLQEVFLSLPQGLPEFTLMIPDIKKQVVATLLDFLYTGKMVLGSQNTYDLQQLVKILNIDPENVRIESPDESKQTRLVQTSVMKLKVPPPATTTANARPPGYGSPSTPSTSSTVVDTVVESKAMPLRATKRKLSQECASGSSSPKDVKFNSPIVLPILPGPSSLSRTTPASARGGLRRRGRPRPSASSGGRRNSSDADAPSGFHDLGNVQTWVCAICKEYDPVLPSNKADSNLATNTEWIGCDCNRWYHQYCTGLKTVDASFCCSLVKLECLPMEN